MRFLEHPFTTIGYEPEREDDALNGDVQMNLDAECEIEEYVAPMIISLRPVRSSSIMTARHQPKYLILGQCEGS